MSANGDLYAGDRTSGVYRSTDDGRTWQSFTSGLPLSLNVQSLVLDDAGYLYAGIGSGGGVYRTVFPVVGGSTVLSASVRVSLTPFSTSAPFISGVENAASYQPAVSPNSWASIKGQNLSTAPARTLRDADIVNGALPVSLDGVSVAVEGVAAPVSSISPGQINILIPALTPGTATLQISNPIGTADFSFSIAAIAPALFPLALSSGSTYAAAIHADGTLVGSSIALPGATPAQPGEVISLFGTGFGSGSTVTALLDSIVAPVTFAGITGPGLEQINVQIPNVADGDHFIVLQSGQLRTQTSLVLNIQRRTLPK